MAVGQPSLAKKLSFALVAIGIALATLEAAARFFVAPRHGALYREHENLITVLGLPSLNATMEFDDELFWKLRDDLKQQPVEGEINGAPISFRVSTVDGLRTQAPRPTAPALRVLALGDSCTFGVGVDDDETWPAQLEKQLRDKGVDAEVINAGVPGYSAFQGRAWFEAHGLALEPDVVVVTFGFNDRDFWSSESDPEIARRLQFSRLGQIASHSRFYVGLERAITGLTSKSAAPVDDRVQRLDPPQFLSVLSSIAKQAQAAGAEVVFAAWPYRAQIEKEVRQPILYQLLVEEAARRAGASLVHLTPRFIDTRHGPEALFVDHVHASALGNRVASETLLGALLRD